MKRLKFSRTLLGLGASSFILVSCGMEGGFGNQGNTEVWKLPEGNVQDSRPIQVNLPPEETQDVLATKATQFPENTPVFEGFPAQVGISSDGKTAAILTTTGDLWLWNENPVQVKGKFVSLDSNPLVAIDKKGRAVYLDTNEVGKPITNSNNLVLVRDEPYEIPLPVAQVASGGSYLAAVDGNNTVWVWGDNTYGQLGYPGWKLCPEPYQTGTENTPGCRLPVPLTGVGDVMQIDTGGDNGEYPFTLVIAKDGTVIAWGDNTCGELGTGDTEEYNQPVEIEEIEGADLVEAGEGFGVAVNGDQVYTWGLNNHGQLGNGTTEDNYTPEVIDWNPPGEITDIQSSGSTVIVIVEGNDGETSLWGWGDNPGQVIWPDEDDYVTSPTEIEIPGLEDGDTIESVTLTTNPEGDPYISVVIDNDDETLPDGSNPDQVGSGNISVISIGDSENPAIDCGNGPCQVFPPAPLNPGDPEYSPPSVIIPGLTGWEPIQPPCVRSEKGCAN